jgi:hypothetical protein
MIGVSILTMVWFVQPYLKLVGLPLVLFGVVWAGLQFSVGIFSFYAHRIEMFVGRKRTFDPAGGIDVGLLLPAWGVPVFVGDIVYSRIVLPARDKLSCYERLYQSDHHVGYTGDGAFCS